MPLAPTLYAGPMSAAMGSTFAENGYSGSSAARRPPIPIRKSMTSDLAAGIVGNLSRRPPLPPNQFQQRPLNKIAVIKPNATTKIVSRSPSPCLSSGSKSCRSMTPVFSRSARSPSVSSVGSHSGASPTPRRTFPQESTFVELDDLRDKEQAPVVFDASLNFVLGIEKQKVRQSFRPTAAHLDPATASSFLSSRIAEFLQRTDHVMDEWKSLGHKDDASDLTSLTTLPHNDRHRPLGRSRSATNIMIKGFQYFSRSNSIAKSPSGSLSRLSEDRTMSEFGGDEVSSRTQLSFPIREFCCLA